MKMHLYTLSDKETRKKLLHYYKHISLNLNTIITEDAHKTIFAF